MSDLKSFSDLKSSIVTSIFKNAAGFGHAAPRGTFNFNAYAADGVKTFPVEAPGTRPHISTGPA